jgi:hypothetical protein
MHGDDQSAIVYESNGSMAVALSLWLTEAKAAVENG